MKKVREVEKEFRQLMDGMRIVDNRDHLSLLFAWGGDHGIIEHRYASLMLAKDLISEVLAAKVASGYFSKKAAVSVAEKIMGGNAIEVYKF